MRSRRSRMPAMPVKGSRWVAGSELSHARTRSLCGKTQSERCLHEPFLSAFAAAGVHAGATHEQSRTHAQFFLNTETRLPADTPPSSLPQPTTAVSQRSATAPPPSTSPPAPPGKARRARDAIGPPTQKTRSRSPFSHAEHPSSEMRRLRRSSSGNRRRAATAPPPPHGSASFLLLVPAAPRHPLPCDFVAFAQPTCSDDRLQMPLRVPDQ
eukprot:2835840-Rhodomonas_salina.2